MRMLVDDIADVWTELFRKAVEEAAAEEGTSGGRLEGLEERGYSHGAEGR